MTEISHRESSCIDRKEAQEGGGRYLDSVLSLSWKERRTADCSSTASLIYQVLNLISDSWVFADNRTTYINISDNNHWADSGQRWLFFSILRLIIYKLFLQWPPSCTFSLLVHYSCSCNESLGSHLVAINPSFLFLHASLHAFDLVFWVLDKKKM